MLASQPARAGRAGGAIKSFTHEPPQLARPPPRRRTSRRIGVTCLGSRSALLTATTKRKPRGRVREGSTGASRMSIGSSDRMAPRGREPSKSAAQVGFAGGCQLLAQQQKQAGCQQQQAPLSHLPLTLATTAPCHNRSLCQHGEGSNRRQHQAQQGLAPPPTHLPRRPRTAPPSGGTFAAGSCRRPCA